MLALFRIDKIGMVEMSAVFTVNVSHFPISKLLYSTLHLILPFSLLCFHKEVPVL